MGRRLLILLAFVACEKRSAKYCEFHPEDLAFCERSDASTDAPLMCSTSATCPASAPFCEPGSSICVECLTSADCAAMPGAPNCDPVMFTCRGCVSHTDCISNACLPDGTCGDDSSVIYVDEAGVDNTSCTAAAPCKLVDAAIDLLTETRRYIRLRGNLVDGFTLTGVRATLLGDPTTTLTGNADPVIKIQQSEVKIFDLAVICPPAPSIAGIKSEMSSTTTLTNVSVTGCGKIGIEGKGGYLRMTRSTAAQNIGGGLVCDAAADFSITNSVFYLNGTPDSANGAVVLLATTSGVNQFEFNTVAHNTAKTGAGGVRCALTNFLAANNNLIVANGGPAQTLGCDFTGSRIDADATPYMFVQANADYHIGELSDARDAATVPSSVTEDFDGQYRPIGTAKDFGADEYKP